MQKSFACDHLITSKPHVQNTCILCKTLFKDIFYGRKSTLHVLLRQKPLTGEAAVHDTLTTESPDCSC